MTTAAVPREGRRTVSPHGIVGSWSTRRKVGEFMARVLLALLFIVAAIEKMRSYEATASFMADAGVAGSLLPLVIALELLGAAAIVVGWQARIAAAALAAFTVLSALLFHFDLADQFHSTMFLKNLGLAGGLILLTVHGAGPLSLDARKSR